MKEQSKRVWSTVFTAVVLLLFYFLAGAVVVTQKLEGTQAYLIQGCFIWCVSLLMIVISLIRNKSLKTLGFKYLKKGSVKDSYFFIPLLAVAFSSFLGGIELSKGLSFILSALFVTLGVGFAEEIACRGIICRIWKEKSPLCAIFVSSIVFALCHLMNIMGGASVIKTMLQVFFALFYGIIMAVIYLRSESIVPCIMIHFLHDFCSFISKNLDTSVEVYIDVFQAVVIVVYTALLLVEYFKKDED